MNLQALKSKVRTGEIDTVVVVFPDVFGRLVGKRYTGQVFLDQVAQHGTHGCNYLLTVNLEMDPMDGFKLANWERASAISRCGPIFPRFARSPGKQPLCWCCAITGITMASWSRKRPDPCSGSKSRLSRAKG